MKDDITKFTVDISFPNDNGPQFKEWFPNGIDDAICFEYENIKGRFVFYFEKHSTGFVEEWEIKSYQNIGSCGCIAELFVSNIDQDVLLAMKASRAERQDISKTDAAVRFDELCHKIHKCLVSHLNRFIGFSQVNKGQYWLEEFVFDEKNISSFFSNHSIYAHWGALKYRLVPFDNTIRLKGSMPDIRRMITRDDWANAREFVRGRSRPELVLQLLTHARRLSASGYRRSAVLEAVTALEISKIHFGKNAVKISSERSITARTEIKSVSALIDAAGLRGTFNFVLPMILSEDQLPIDIIKSCRAAIDHRNNIIHQGQRDVPEDTMPKMLHDVEECCRILYDLVC